MYVPLSGQKMAFDADDADNDIAWEVFHNDVSVATGTNTQPPNNLKIVLDQFTLNAAPANPPGETGLTSAVTVSLSDITYESLFT